VASRLSDSRVACEAHPDLPLGVWAVAGGVDQRCAREQDHAEPPQPARINWPLTFANVSSASPLRSPSGWSSPPASRLATCCAGI